MSNAASKADYTQKIDTEEGTLIIYFWDPSGIDMLFLEGELNGKELTKREVINLIGERGFHLAETSAVEDRAANAFWNRVDERNWGDD